jgi:transaldolase/transaldolase/glucose-6-phosphate isomerase
MDSGKLISLIEEDGVSGVTANPSIFERAISSSEDYQEDINKFSRQGNDNESTYIKIALKDIKRAAGLFDEIYNETNGRDGFVSIEVSPHLAYNTEGTIKQAREFWDAINRKNVMIKIPGTAQGLPAVRKSISEGININVTLLFGLPRYRQVADVYLEGLEERIANNKPVDQITSVCSFFLSRIDALIDPLLEQKGLARLKGKVAIASAKNAYQIYKKVFNSERFKKLEAKGARRQRVLWASTSSKDPTFSDVKYIEALIGPETINTLPIETLEAFNDHGKAESRLDSDVNEASDILVQLTNNAIDIDAITRKLEDEGIEKFNNAYDNLLKAIETQKLRTIY